MSCTGLSKEAIRGLEVQAKEVGQAYWACRACMNFSNKWHSQMREVNKRQEETEARVEANTDKIEEVRLNTEELRREFREYVQRTEGIQERLEAVMDAELREREARRLNLVIHGLQEPAENIKDPRGRMEQDKIECERLFIAMKARTRYQAIRFCRGERRGPQALGLRSIHGRGEETPVGEGKGASLHQIRRCDSGTGYDKEPEERRAAAAG